MMQLSFRCLLGLCCIAGLGVSLSSMSGRSPTKHYANTPMQYTAIFHGCKNVIFQMKKYNIFLIFAQNIDCGYTL